ncbi:hypothetical protein F5B20DRAFT_586355 [Whalleya microplaca]|nr:hypothetical protein F5B20DRAFT_586355 [Whalleya microplaca]
MAPPYKREECTPEPDDSAEFVTITVPTGEKFGVHAHLLGHHSEYFRKALNGPFKEATTCTFNLSVHATEETVSTFIRWIYLRHAGQRIEEYNLVFHLGHIFTDKAIQAWLFGDYIQATEFRNDIMRLIRLISSTTYLFNYQDIAESWSLLPAASNIRAYVLDYYISKIFDSTDNETFITEVDNLPADMARAVLKRLAIPMRQMIDGGKSKPCDWFNLKVDDYLENV